jgi:hypothetical protein
MQILNETPNPKTLPAVTVQEVIELIRRIMPFLLR